MSNCETELIRRKSRRWTCGTLIGLASGLVAAALAAEDPFAANVRSSDPLTPEEQLRQFEVPEGFAVQLVGAEPDIHKPMNLAFDAAGRLWVTSSREYPRPAPPDRPGRDRVTIFEDFGPDGRARKVTEFASGLNIPIGVYPYRSAGADGRMTWKAVVWSIPHVWLFEDVDGDGKADRRERLYGPFDYTRDTHGNQASFRRGFDGWMYATHGFNNDSRVAGRDGHTIRMQSGNTYRVRLDGSRIEGFSWGQVNPFGMAWDPEGNLYSSDCHSEPIYMLLPGAYYPSFGKPHDGLGFAPSMMERIRGSTAIDGVSYSAEGLWPEAYRDSLFIGDVMTSRVYRDKAVPRGSARVARPEPDFVISRDPWFRPVDTTFGPDGAMYIADFYNRIIGHYEVPLDHPGRDRERGRIWRVVPTGVPLRSPALEDSIEGLLREMASSSLTRRLLAMHEVEDRFGHRALARLEAARRNPADGHQLSHVLWLLHRLGGLDNEALIQAGRHAEEAVRIHAFRIVSERARWMAATPPNPPLAHPVTRAVVDLTIAALGDPSPVVQRVAAEALGWRPRFRLVRPILDLRHRVGTDDPHLLYTVRRTLRELLARDEVMTRVLDAEWSEADRAALLDVSVAVPSELAARFLIRRGDFAGGDAAWVRTALTHAARHAGAEDGEALVTLVRRRMGDDVDYRLGLFRSVQQGLAQRGGPLGPTMRAWGEELAGQLLDSVRGSGGWVNVPVEGALPSANPWDFQERPCDDGQTARLLSSHPRGEALTGVLRSRPFAAPARLSFYLAGHDGPPGEPARGRNRVRLVAAGSGEILAEAAPPRNDTARRIEWNLTAHAGKPVVLEVVDGDNGGAFAWLAWGRLEPATVPWPEVAPAQVVSRQVAAAELANVVEAGALDGPIGALMRDRNSDPAARAAAARRFLSGPLERAALDLMADGTQPYDWRAGLADAVLSGDGAAREAFVLSVWKDAPRRFQLAIAGVAAVEASATARLVAWMEDGLAPAGLLQDNRLRDRLRRVASGDVQRTMDRLLSELPDEDAEVDRLLEARRAEFLRARTDLSRGRDVYGMACAACHQLEGQGGLVGPQLSGIGTRGVERLIEDILAPNRNVDHAFWTTSLTLRDGDVVTGLFRREEGALLVLANSAGLEFTMPKAEVTERRESGVSLMPSNYAEALSEEDFHHLLAYLLAQRGQP
ncbi:MAG: c-type cytochrome [Verrucomicrobiae bacterium]|nr:c-type cytochrome [Verrucomicrobiae bacterium]